MFIYHIYATHKNEQFDSLIQAETKITDSETYNELKAELADCFSAEVLAETIVIKTLTYLHRTTPDCAGGGTKIY